MILDAMVDRVENNSTYFVLDEIGAQISISGEDKEFNIGDVVKLVIADEDGQITVLRQ